MVGERDDSLQSISVRLDGRNYSYWSYVMKNFLKDKKLWGYVTGSYTKPMDPNTEKYVELLDIWDANNSKIITWINNSVEQTIGTQLAKFETAQDVWDYLARLYTQSNFAKQYQLEVDIRAVRQGTMSIQEFYNTMSNLWYQLALTESSELQAFAPYISRREEQRLVQFLMALRDDFEGLRGTILHRNPLPSVDSVVNELLAEEIRLKSQAGKGLLPVPDPSVLAVPRRSFTSSQPKRRAKVGHDECSFCKQKGHWKSQCPQLLRKSSTQQSQRGSQSSHTSSTGSGSSSSSSPNFAALVEQFQKFLTVQPHAISTSSSLGLSSSEPSGDLKKLLAHETGLEPREQRLLFRGKEKEDEECLHMVGVKDLSKVILLEDPASKERKLEEMKRDQGILKACEAVNNVRAEVDKLAEKASALESSVRNGTKVIENEFNVLTELLMVQLLKLDSIEAEGEAKVQRRIEVRRVQSLVETLDSLKARNANPFSKSPNAVSVTTKWETFDSGLGSLQAPPPVSSSRITKDWEQFD